jgi:ArsR family transcriptional regulator
MISELFKVLGDLNRLRILRVVMEKEVCVCELEDILSLSQTNTSRHLAKLKSHNIVSTTKKAQWVYYKLNNDFIIKNKDLVNHIVRITSEDEVFKADIENYKKYLKTNCEDKSCCGGKK